jgi:hypothetical protein
MRSRRILALVVLVAAGLLLASAAGGAARATSAGDRTVTLVNNTRVTIWPAVWPGSV